MTQRKYNRKEFLKLAALAQAALYVPLLSCNGNSTGKNGKEDKPVDSIATEKETALPEKKVTYYKKGDKEYELLRKGFNKRIDKFPSLIALCKDTEEVAIAVKYAVANKLPVAIKSGGHCMEGFSVNDGGMVINLSELNKIGWVDKEIFTTGPGAKLSQLYDELLPKQRIIPGGSCSGVGIGGLTLGGGYGLLARNFGLTCDSLLEVTMVDGKGNIVKASGSDELLWACKGGGNGNFGVVTEMKFRSHPAPATLQGYRFKSYKTDTAKARYILQQWFDAAATLPPTCFSAFVLNGKTVYILLTNTAAPDAAVNDFISKMSAANEKTTQTKAEPLARALKVFYGRQAPLYFKNASAGLYKNFADIESCIDAAIDTVLATPGMIYQVNTLGGNIADKNFETASAFPHRAYPYFSELQTYWESPKQEAKLLERFRQVEEIFTANGISAQYRNYPDVDFKNWQSAYYGTGYERLQQLKEKYDPDNTIRHPQSVSR